jgi:hypothetical protein
MSQYSEPDRLAAIAQDFRASSALGRSATLYQLFDYLLERTLRGETPREIDIAADVFGRVDPDFLTDASVRVYVHRLRKKLDDYYNEPGTNPTERLTLPKGDYRFQIADVSPQKTLPGVPALSSAPSVTKLLLVLIVGLIAGSLLAFAVLRHATTDGLEDVRASPIWSELIAGRRPLALVGGDYYIFGERDDPKADANRLVREFKINSREDLALLQMREPALRERYVDLDLYYLPVSTAHALRSIMPILTPPFAGGRPISVVPSSKLSPVLLKDCDVVYVGLLSGLGLLQEPVLANSRFAVGGSFDEIIDTKTSRIYVADAPTDQTAQRRDYAYVAMLPGPSGNRILIIAGTRDAALRQSVDTLSSAGALRSLADAAKDGYFEALYAVEGVGDQNLRATLIAAVPRSINGMWDGSGSGTGGTTGPP